MSSTSLCLTLVSLVVIQFSLSTIVTGQNYSAYACLNHNIVIECQNGKNISITDGFLGQYDNCASTCCVPDMHNDCRGDLQQLYPDDMTELREICDYQSRCDTYRVLGGNLAHCPGARVAQYLQVFHRCLPEDPTTVPPPTTEAPTSPSPSTTTTMTTRQPPPIPQTTPAEQDGGLSGGVIAAIVIGVLLFIAIIAMVLVIIWRKLHPPPKPKKVVRRPMRKKNTTVYDNPAFASSDQVVVHLNEESKTIPNGVHNNNSKKTAAGAAPMSDGKRKTKPVTTAESFRYAQEKEELAKKYKTDGSGGQKLDTNTKKVPATGEGVYYNMNKSKKLKGSNTNVYQNVS